MKKSSRKLDCISDIPWFLLTKLLMIDYSGRDDIISENVKRQLSSDKKVSSAEELEEEFPDLFSESSFGSTSGNSSSTPHPLDVLVVVFSCCSNFLRQILCEKMFMCKLSIPLLLPPFVDRDTLLLLWSLRTISFELQQPNEEFTDHSVVNQKIPVISFLRMGEILRSKSKILNELLNGQSHPTFHHKDCEGGMNQRSVSEGLIEIAWNLPKRNSRVADKETFLFQRLGATLLNLRGDGKLHESARKFLFQISNVILIMMDIGELGEQNVIDSLKLIASKQVESVVMLTKQKNSDLSGLEIKAAIDDCIKKVESDNFKKDNFMFDFNTKGEKNIKVLKEETEQKLSKCLKKSNLSHTIADFKGYVSSLPIIIDEDIPECIEGREKASRVIKIVCENGKNNIRKTCLPLQHTPWHEWSKLNKEENRREKRGMNHLAKYMDKVHLDKKAQRKEQLRLLEKPTKLFEVFLKSLNCKDEVRLYYLKWLRLLLDDISREILPGLQRRLCSKWNEIHECEDKRKLVGLQNELTGLEDVLSESSFGLEHFLREIAQAYECVSDLGKIVAENVREKITRLPRTMAELMLHGYPIELMDGDAASVPLLWVESVLNHLRNLIGNKKIFVLSVLGIQSSGKSTLLNTMFGLQFAVAAGRCTRGVYAQLVPIPQECSCKEYDYVLVVDTEGLRAAELGGDKLQHDNEIATLVVGLGDVTLVNLKGENVAEMEDILQIVVHALLKMKLVNKNLALQPSCYFIHQNVPAPDAAQKLRSGQQKFIESLDKVTKAAGKQEDMPQYTKFSQVIEFDINTNVSYFSDLWRGDPPMGHANPGYSENVSKVKHELLSRIMPNRTSHLNFQKFCTKVRDLWCGILGESFVFSFKNSLELEAYNSLESKLSDVTWALKKTALKWQNDKENVIMSSDCVSEELKNSIRGECCLYLGKFYTESTKSLQGIFEGNEDRSILEQWKVRTFKKFESCYEDIIDRTTSTLKSKFMVKQIQADQNKRVEEYKAGIMGEAKKLAEDLRTRKGAECIDDVMLEGLFKEKWRQWIESLPEGKEYCINIEEKVADVLYERFRQDSAIVNKALGNQQTQDSMIHGNFEHAIEAYVSKRKILGFIPNRNSKINGKEFLDDAYRKINSLVKATKDQDLKREQGGSLMKIANDLVQAVKNTSGLVVAKEEEFEICIAICVSQYATCKFFKSGTNEVAFSSEYQLQDYGIHPYLEEELLCKYSRLMTVLHKSQRKGLHYFLFNIEEHVIPNKDIGEEEARKCIINLVNRLDDDVESYVNRPEIQDFKEEYVEEIINLVLNRTKEAIAQGILGKELKITVAVHVCFVALPKFIEKHRRYTDSLNPRRVLERDYYGTYLQLFKNAYKQVTGEMALTSLFSEHLCSAMKAAVDRHLASDLAEDIRNNVPQVKMKHALLKAILNQLLEEDNFEDFMLYLKDINACFDKWIAFFINNYLFTKEKNNINRYNVIASKNVDSIISRVCQEILRQGEAWSKHSLRNWIREFQENISGTIVISQRDLLCLADGHKIISIQSFTIDLEKKLRATEEKLKTSFRNHSERHLKKVQGDNVYELISAECKGCTEKCPFCSAPCTLNTVGHREDGDGVKHMAKEHYPKACGRYRYSKSEKLVTDNCSLSVAGDGRFQCKETKWKNHPYKRYHEVFPDWKIDGDPSVDASPYWKWFLVKYETQLAERYNAQRPNIPISWREITKEEAKNSLGIFLYKKLVTKAISGEHCMATKC